MLLSEVRRELTSRLRPLGWTLDGWSPHHRAWEASRLVGGVRAFLRASEAELVLLCNAFDAALARGGES